MLVISYYTENLARLGGVRSSVGCAARWWNTLAASLLPATQDLVPFILRFKCHPSRCFRRAYKYMPYMAHRTTRAQLTQCHKDTVPLQHRHSLISICAVFVLDPTLLHCVWLDSSS
jgi:hypothetical protein